MGNKYNALTSSPLEDFQYKIEDLTRRMKRLDLELKILKDNITKNVAQNNKMVKQTLNERQKQFEELLKK